MLRKNWRDYEVTNKIDEIENTTDLYIVFEEDTPTPQSHDLCHGVFNNLEVAREYAESIRGDIDIYVAKYADYISGAYEYI